MSNGQSSLRQKLNSLGTRGDNSGSTPVHDIHAKEKYEIIDELTTKLRESLSGLKDTIDKSVSSQDSLGGKLFWLNVILTGATVVGAIATAVMAWNSLK